MIATERNVLMANRTRHQEIRLSVDGRLEELVVAGISTRLDPFEDRDSRRELRQRDQGPLAQAARHVPSNFGRRRTSVSSASVSSERSSSPHSSTSLTALQGVDRRRRKKLTMTLVSTTTGGLRVIEQLAQLAAAQASTPGLLAGFVRKTSNRPMSGHGLASTVTRTTASGATSSSLAIPAATLKP